MLVITIDSCTRPIMPHAPDAIMLYKPLYPTALIRDMRHIPYLPWYEYRHRRWLYALVPRCPQLQPVWDRRQRTPITRFIARIGNGSIVQTVKFENRNVVIRRVTRLGANVRVECARHGRESREITTVIGGAGECVKEAAAVGFASAKDGCGVDIEVACHVSDEVGGEDFVAYVGVGVSGTLPDTFTVLVLWKLAWILVMEIFEQGWCGE